MIQAFRKLHSFYRGFEAAEQGLEQAVGRPVCMANCGRCCEVNTPKCMTIEAINALSILAGTDERLQKAVSTAEGWLLEHHKEAPTYEGMISGRFLPVHVRKEFETLSSMPCPFLDSSKSCTLHEARPMVCRAYGVTRAGSFFCPRPLGKNEAPDRMMYMKGPELRADISRFKENYMKSHPEWVIFGFLPTLLVRAAKEKEFRSYVADNRIATAKLVGTQLDITLMWQVQVDQLRIGVSPDLVAAEVG